MSRDEHSQAVRMVLDFAERHPDQGLGFARLPEVRAHFATIEELVDALQRDWSRRLHHHLEQVSRDPQRNLLSAAMVARVAWAETAQRNPVLCRLLDSHAVLIDATARRREELLINVGVAVA